MINILFLAVFFPFIFSFFYNSILVNININRNRNILDPDEEDDIGDDTNTNTNTNTNTKYYQDKYLDEFRNMKDRAVSLTEEELQSLKHSLVVEYTPVGNVAMFYDHKRESFTYYSDTTIPYRFLEVVGRKYVLTNNCKSIFVDMSEELKEYEEKIQKQKEREEKEKEKEEKQVQVQPIKKNVFAKFKSYNNNNTKSSVSTPAKEMQKIVEENKENDVILKEKSNRYTCEGRFSNFAILKKVDKKVTNKRLAMTFAEFKKMQTCEK